MADVILIAAAVLFLFFVKPLSGAACWCIALLFCGGAWASIWPWMQEERTKAALSELDGTKSIEESVRKMAIFAQGINTSLSALENAQKAMENTTKALASVDEKMSATTKDWERRVSKAAQYEKNTFILEVNKLRQEEKGWIETGMGLLDHILGFTGAGLASHQPQIVEQMSRFRGACLEITSRIGIQPVLPARDEPYNPDMHRLPPNAPQAEPGSKIAHVLAPGYIYQGQLVRKTTVLVEGMTLPQNPMGGITTSNVTLTNDANTTTLSSSSDIPENEASESRSFTPAEPLHDEDKAEEKTKPEGGTAPVTETENNPDTPEPTLDPPAAATEETVEESPAETQESQESETTSEKTSEESELDDANLFRQETFESIPPKAKSEETAPPEKEKPAKHEDLILPFAEQNKNNDDQLPL